MPLKPHSPFSRFMVAGAALAAVLLAGVVYVHESGALSPGQLSASQRYGTPLGGYASHAEFEQSCTHCHAPVHCITEARCQTCHQEVARQRLEAEGLHGRIPSARCQSCHIEHQGRQTAITEFAFANIDHNQLAGFSLASHHSDYQGNPLTCQSCHSQDRFVKETLDCTTCHAQGDHNFTASHMEQYGPHCADCHDGHDRMANFDHDQYYPLAHRHAQALCTDCHQDHRYAGTPTECAACHQEPEMHLGQFGLDCVRCHTDAAWKPAQLTRHTFPLNHGSPAALPCETCHATTYAGYTCYGCHDHTPAQMETAHAAANVSLAEPCAACHPTGQRNEMEHRLPLPPGQDRQNLALQ